MGTRTLDESEMIRQAMSIYGKRRSPAKAAAARVNGLKGGRPKGKKKSRSSAGGAMG